MRVSATLSRYIGLRFVAGIALAFLVLVALIFLIDLVELMRRAANRDGVTLFLLVQMALLKSPSMAQKITPFATLFGGIWAFTHLTRRHELVVARGAGVSAWQFLSPAIGAALLLGLIMVGLFDPIASAMAARFERMEARYLRGGSGLLALSPSGVWLRQHDPGSRLVVHADRVNQDGSIFIGVIMFLYDGAERYAGRIDAESASLSDGAWHVTNAWQSGADGALPVPRDALSVPTRLTPARIRESFASPEALSLWSLPPFIELLEGAGFSTLRHRLHWHSLLAQPLLLCAMVLIAAAASLRLTRHGGVGYLVMAGAAAGFALYVLSDLSAAIGLAGSVPVVLAAWMPAGVTTLLGIALLFHLEDG